MNKDQKVALVLGGIKGIGKGIGLALAQDGIRVALPYHDWEESLPDLKRDFAQTGIDHLIIRINLLETEKIFQFVQQVVDHFNRLDILINNIERGGWPVVHGKYNQKQWDLEMATTLRAKQWVFDAALPHLRKSQNACVINFSSIAGIILRIYSLQGRRWYYELQYLGCNYRQVHASLQKGRKL